MDLNAVFLSVGSVVDLALDDQSSVFAHQPFCSDHVFNLVELCSGAVLSAIGFTRLVFKHRCAFERQPRLAELHAAVHPGVPVVCADITSDATAGLVSARCPEPSTIMSGFSCQPFSRGGIQQGGSDSHASSLPGTLRLMHLLQAPALVLECVAQARDNQYVQDHIQALNTQLGLYVSDCLLKLEDVWAARRHRWWMIATHPCIGPVSIPNLQQSSNLAVRDLMPYVHRWPASEEEQLILTPHEVENFNWQVKPSDSMESKQTPKFPPLCTAGEDKPEPASVNVDQVVSVTSS